MAAGAKGAKIERATQQDVLEAIDVVREAEADLTRAEKGSTDARVALDQAQQNEEAARTRAVEARNDLLAKIRASR